MSKLETFQPLTGQTVLEKTKGYTIWKAMAFIIGELAGVGILSLPHAVAQTGWWGLVIVVYCAICSATAGICLAKCWIILEERYPNLRRGLTRKPFATIGYHAFGPLMGTMVSAIMIITRSGAGTVVLLLTSSLAHSITQSWAPLSLCQWIPVMAALLMVPLWLGSPADFWPIAYLSTLSSVTGTLLLCYQIILHILAKGIATEFYEDSLETFVSAFGVVLFAFGGAGAFPSFQNDMKKKAQFPKAAMWSFLSLIILYLPSSGLGFLAFGRHTQTNIVENLPPSLTMTIVEICFFLNCITIIFVLINPVFLDLEEHFKIPKRFNWRRCLIRSTILFAMTSIGETFPNFGQVLDLIGSTNLSLMAYLLPLCFYVKLVKDQELNKEWPKRELPMYRIAFFALVGASAIGGGLASAYTTLKHWAPMDTACYFGNNWAYNATRDLK